MSESDRSASEVMSAIAKFGFAVEETARNDDSDPRSIGAARRAGRSQRLMPGAWETETLAAVAGVLCRDHPQLSTFEIVRLVCHVAHSEPASGGEIRLLHRVRQEIAAQPPAPNSGGE
jgi:hypothetical protein